MGKPQALRADGLHSHCLANHVDDEGQRCGIRGRGGVGHGGAERGYSGLERWFAASLIIGEDDNC